MPPTTISGSTPGCREDSRTASSRTPSRAEEITGGQHGEEVSEEEGPQEERRQPRQAPQLLTGREAVPNAPADQAGRTSAWVRGSLSVVHSAITVTPAQLPDLGGRPAYAAGAIVA
jgi:hypothetical protein